MAEENNENENDETNEEENDDYEEKPLTREDFFRALEIVSGAEDDD
jgi:hypothetical protein